MSFVKTNLFNDAYKEFTWGRWDLNRHIGDIGVEVVKQFFEEHKIKCKDVSRTEPIDLIIKNYGIEVKVVGQRTSNEKDRVKIDRQHRPAKYKCCEAHNLDPMTIAVQPFDGGSYLYYKKKFKSFTLNSMYDIDELLCDIEK